MKVCFAPMEGVAHHLYRGTQAACFQPADEYFIPFINPRNRSFSNRERLDVLPENNEGVHAVPQLLTRDPACFLWAAWELYGMGYREVNLNLGCPSGTVVSKHTGAGMLKYPEELSNFLTEIFMNCPMEISVKTRLGMTDTEEFEQILEIYNRFPILRLIVHPRVREDYYRAPVRMAGFELAMAESRAPVWYNGDLFTAWQVERFCEANPQVAGVMCGRGFLMHPGLMDLLRHTGEETPDRISAFHDRLYAGYQGLLHNERYVLSKMKEVWAELGKGQPIPHKALKRIRKAADYGDYEAAVAEAISRMGEAPGDDRDDPEADSGNLLYP